MKRKIGNLLIDGRKFPIWIENIAEDRLLFAIQIVCSQNDAHFIDNEFVTNGYQKRWLGQNEGRGVFKFKERENVVLELQRFVDDKIADINFDKLDDLFTQIDKQFVLRRLKG